MRKCPYCGSENKDEAFRCKNEECSEILPQSQSKEKSNINNAPQEKVTITSVNPKRLLELLLGFLALGIIMFGVMSYLNSCEQKAKEKAKENEADLQRIRRSRQAVEHAREYWGGRYETWENSVGNPPSIKGKRGELGLTPIHYPSLGITVIVDDDNKIIHVEQN